MLQGRTGEHVLIEACDALASTSDVEQQRPILDVTIVVELADPEALGGCDTDEGSEIGVASVDPLTAWHDGSDDASTDDRSGSRCVDGELVDVAVRAVIATRIEGIGSIEEGRPHEVRVRVRVSGGRQSRTATSWQQDVEVRT